MAELVLTCLDKSVACLDWPARLSYTKGIRITARKQKEVALCLYALLLMDLVA